MTERLPDAIGKISAGTGIKRKIRVAVMLTPVEFGGAERVCLTLFENIDREQFDVVPVLLTRPWEETNSFVRRLRADGYEPREIPVASQEFGDYTRVFRCYRLVWKLLRDGGFDVVHTNGYFADIVGLPVARLNGLATVSTCHGYIPSTWNVRLYNAIDRFSLRFGTQILAVSEKIKQDLENSGVGSKKVQVIVNAVGPKRTGVAQSGSRDAKRGSQSISSNDFVVGYVGRLSLEKGLIYFLNACVELVDSGVPLKALIVGDGPQRAELENKSRQLGLADRVVFVGFQEDIVQWLPCMDVFVLPSLTEGTPMALLEAMSHGIAAVASAVGGVPQVIEHGTTGLLVAPGEVREISDAILRLHKNPEMRRTLARNAADLVRTRYGVAEWIGRIESTYRGLSKRDF